MSGLLAAAGDIQRFLRQSGERFCFIGAIALQRWGEPRATRDVDLTLLCPFGREAQAVDRVLSAFAARIEDARAFAMHNRVLLVRSADGVPIDIALGGIAYEERCVARASEFDFGPVALLTCSAEDLVVLKAFAGRSRDWADIETVVMRQAARLDWKLVFEELEPLAALREPADTLERLQRLRNAE